VERFIQLFGPSLQFTYASFDRMVINGYLTALCTPNHAAYFFRYICGIETITDEILRGRTEDYRKFVEGYALPRQIPIEWAPQGVRKEEFLQPRLNRFLRRGQTGVYTIFKSMEQGTTFRISKVKNPSEKQKLHPHLQGQRSRFTYYYFYLVDPILGPMVLRFATFLPFTMTAYINGHNFIEGELLKQGIDFCMKDNSFTRIQNSEVLQQIADSLSADVIARRLDFWSLLLGPKFSNKQRLQAPGLKRLYAINQIEYCRNFIFRNHFPIASLFERSCDLSLYRMQADTVANLFATRITRRSKGRFQSVLARNRQGQPVFRAYCKNSFLKQYKKSSTVLRNETVCNNLKELRLRKSLRFLPEIKEKLADITDRFSDLQAEALNTYPDFDLFALLAKPVQVKTARIAGIRLEQDRMVRIMELFLNAAAHLGKWTSKSLLQAVQEKYSLGAHQYTITQLRYDLRKLAAHQLLIRDKGRYTYSLTEKGKKVSLMFILLRKKVYGPIAGSLFLYKPAPAQRPLTRLERSYRLVDHSINKLLQLLSA